MCILSIFSQPSGDFILTQNRDESIYRQTSRNAEVREFFGHKVIGPVDLNSGGTWIYHTDKYAVCVLNGGYEKHMHKPPYKKSRGLIILELLKYDSVEEFIPHVELDGIEAFTMVIINLKQNQKNILVWDGKQKFREDVSTEKLIVRSSSTLYDISKKYYHKQVFENSRTIQPLEIYNTHKNLAMPANMQFPGVQSTSITQIIHQGNRTELKFCPIEV